MALSVGHKLQIATQYFLGRGRGGFAWAKESAPAEVLRTMLEVLEGVARRVRAQLALSEHDAEPVPVAVPIWQEPVWRQHVTPLAVRAAGEDSDDDEFEPVRVHVAGVRVG